MVKIQTFAVAIVTGWCCLVAAQDSAPSSHFVFNDNFDGDIIINEVRIPEDGEALYTYYEALGWRGKGAGYAGLQAHPRAHNFIFSIWDHKDHTAAIKAVHHGPGTETKGFGGEGTGLKSWNFELGWKKDVWYTLVARTWPVEDHTYYGFWSLAGDTSQWTHLVTMDVAVEDARFRGGTDAFIEDWLSTGVKPRTSNLRGGWKRKMDGMWFPFAKGRYSVNAWDLVEGKRSFQHRTHWDGGVRGDGDTAHYFMTAGGEETKPSVENPSQHTIARTKTEPAYDCIAIENAKATLSAGGELRVAWTVRETSSPQFAYEVTIVDSATSKVVKSIKRSVPNERSLKIDKSGLREIGLTPESHTIKLELIDIFDQRSKPQSVQVVVEGT